MSNAPAELVLTGGVVGWDYLDQFDPAAPLAGCRLCGKVYQTKYHRRLHLEGRTNNDKLLQLVLDLNTIWREKHTRECHSEDEVEKFTKTGFAFTPEAAHKLAPFGIVPLGNMHVDIADGMYEAPRAPDLTNLEGGE